MLDKAEIALAKRLRSEGKTLTECADLLGRSREAVRQNTTPSILKKKFYKKKGRPTMINEQKFQRIKAECTRAHASMRARAFGGRGGRVWPEMIGWVGGSA